MSATTGSSRVSRSGGKGKEAVSRAASPGRDEDLEDMETAPNQPVQPTDVGGKKARKKAAIAAAEEEETEELPKGLKESDAFIFKIRQKVTELYHEGNKRPTNEEIAEAVGEDEEKVASARKALTTARKGQKLSGMRKSALKAGFSRRQNPSRAEVRGLDIEQSLLTPSDIVRLATALPLNMAKGSYDETELNMRMELMNEKIPIGSAREIIAFLEPHYRGVITDCVERQSRTKTQRITASTMGAALKKFNDLGVFTAVVPPEGLVRFGKEDGVDLVKRGDPDSGYLMEATPDEKKKWRALDKKENKISQEKLVQAYKELADQKESRKRKADEVAAEASAAASGKAKKGKKAEA